RVYRAYACSLRRDGGDLQRLDDATRISCTHAQSGGCRSRLQRNSACLGAPGAASAPRSLKQLCLWRRKYVTVDWSTALGSAGRNVSRRDWSTSDASALPLLVFAACFRLRWTSTR